MIQLTDPAVVIVLMLFMHVFEDFYLQGIMAQLKQKSWWPKNVPVGYIDKCRHDYIPALLMHALEWSICICLPLLLIMNDASIWLVMIGVNTLVHAYIDHLKCNKMKINLCIDQTMHILQIMMTYAIAVVV